MRNNTLALSDSLIGSLCRELEFIKQRYMAVNSSLNLCKNNLLKSRLDNELTSLRARKEEINKIACQFVDKNKSSSLSILFLIEMCRRCV